MNNRKNTSHIAKATPKDAPAMSAIFARIMVAQQSDRPSDPEYIRAFYIEHADIIRCSIAFDTSNKLMGFQVLRHALPDNPYGVTPGWGIIGTYVNPHNSRTGIGSALFEATKKAAIQANLTKIDATIGANNTAGLAYYNAMGFSTYQKKPELVCKLYEV